MESRLGRALMLVAAPFAGAAVGVVGSFLQLATPLGLPVGLGVSLAASLAVLVASAVIGGGRAAAAMCFLGWLLVVLALSRQRPEGDLVITSAWTGVVWLFGGTMLLAVGLATAGRTSRSR